MENKKSNRANLEKRRGSYFAIGLVLSLSAALIAFEYESVYELPELNGELEIEDPITVEMVPITKKKKPVIKKETSPTKKKKATNFNFLVNNKPTEVDSLIVDTLDIDDLLADTEIDAYFTEEFLIEEEPDLIHLIPDQMPEYYGGMEAMRTYLSNEIRYPNMARDSKTEGRVHISFVIEKDGRISSVKALNDIGGGCTEEALRVVKSMRDWKPGKQKGRPVRTQMTLPVNFKLRR